MTIAVGWKARTGLVLSAIWLCLVLIVADEHGRLNQVIGLGFLPLLVIWGIVWAVSGWRAQRLPSPKTDEAVQAEKRERRRAQIRTAVALVVVFFLGLFAATWQFHSASNEQGGNAIAGWFGEWLVYGFFVYVFLRAIPKLPYGVPVVLATLVVVGAVNWKAYSAIAEDRQALASLARATPLLNKIQSGLPVSDQEVLNAHVGVFEPLLLAQARYGNEVVTIATNYQQAIAGLTPETMLTPALLASNDTRFQTRAKIKIWQLAVAEYKSQIDAATARAKFGMQAALTQMPEALGRKASAGFDEGSALLSEYIDDYVKTEKEAREAVTAILNLLDANPGSYIVDKGPPPNLLFRDAKILAQYRHHFGTILDVGKREQESQARFLQLQKSRTERLSDLLRK